MNNLRLRLAVVAIVLIAVAVSAEAAGAVVTAGGDIIIVKERVLGDFLAAGKSVAIQAAIDGVDAVPSYRHIPETGKVSQERLLATVEKTQADAAIITRLVRAEERIDASPGYHTAFPAIGLYGLYSSAWYAGFYTPGWIRQYPVFFSETTLYDVLKDEVVWTATIRTIDPDNIDEATENLCRDGGGSAQAKESAKQIACTAGIDWTLSCLISLAPPPPP